MSRSRRGPKRKHYVVTFEHDVWERWTEIGLCEGFQSDSSVARFLLSLYSDAGGQNGKVSDRRCVGCCTILPLLCARCQFPSCMAAPPQGEVGPEPQPPAHPMPSGPTTLSMATPSAQALLPVQAKFCRKTTPSAQASFSQPKCSSSREITPSTQASFSQPKCSTSREMTPSTEASFSVYAKSSRETAPAKASFSQSKSSTETTPSAQALPPTQSTSFTQWTLGIQAVSSPQVKFTVQEADVSELKESGPPVSTTVTLATSSSHAVMPPGLLASRQTQVTAGGKGVWEVTSSSDPVKPTGQDAELSASQNKPLPCQSSSTGPAVSTLDTVHLEEDMDDGQHCEVIDDIVEDKDVDTKWGVYEKTAQLAFQPPGEIQTDMCTIKEESAQLLLVSEAQDNHKHEDTRKKAAACQHSSYDTDKINSVVLDGKKHGSKRKGKNAKHSVTKKKRQKSLRIRLKETRNKMHTVPLALEGSRKDKKPANNKLITYEPKAVLGKGKKIGRYFYYSEYVCACCDRVFSGKAEFNKHITDMKMQQERTSHGECDQKQKKCPKCSQIVELGQVFTQHMKSHRASKLTCRECGAQFISKQEFARHVKAHQGDRPFLCPICGEGFKMSGHLSNHMVTHSTVRAFMCSVCGMAFKSAGILRGHELTHTGERTFQCQQCGRSFARRHTLNMHMLIHSRQKPFQCDQCSATFINSTKLRYHRTIHNTHPDFKCEECGTIFACPTSLRNHRRIHTGEKPCVCTVCDKTFARPAYLRNHMKFHSSEKPHRCKHCICAFRKRQSLKHHLKTVHPEMCGLPPASHPSPVMRQRCVDLPCDVTETCGPAL